MLFFGPQGSGKGTQAELISQKFGFLHISSGNTLRSIAKTKTPLGRYLMHQLSTGSLTPIDKLMEVFEAYMKRVSKDKNILFDGYARQITETRIFLRKLKKLGRQIDLAVLIDISAAESVERLGKRGVCSKCGWNVILTGKLKVGGKCPKCGDQIIQRKDDTPEGIRRRLALYRKRTLPVIKMFRLQGRLVKINGEQSVAAVHKDVVKAIKKRGLAGKV